MSAPRATDMALLAKQVFARKRIRLPDQWPQVFSHSAAAFRLLVAATPPAERDVPDAPLGPDLLFERHLPLRLFAEVQEEQCRTFASFIDEICAAICAAWATWESSAKVLGVVYLSGMANGGQVQSAPWAPSILAQGPKVPWTAAIASAVGTTWQLYEASLRLVMAPLFIGNLSVPIPPGGDAVPGVPGPSGPVPLKVACPAQLPILKEPLLALMKAVPPPPPERPGEPPRSYGPHTDALYDALAEAFVQCFNDWSLAALLDSTQFLLTSVNPSPAPIPRIAAVAPTTTGPFLIVPERPPRVWEPLPHQIAPAPRGAPPPAAGVA